MKALNKYIKESILDIDTGIDLADKKATKSLEGLDVISSNEIDKIPGIRKLKILVIPNGVKTIGADAFKNQVSGRKESKVEILTLPSTLTRIEDSAFRSMMFLKDVQWVGPVRNGVIGKEVFCSCIGLESVHIPEGVISIGERAFDTCANLKNISLPGTLTNIYYGAFTGCNGLTSIDLSHTKIRLIAEWTFARCRKLEEVSFSKKCTTLDTEAFRMCDKLKVVHIPGLEEIGQGAFYGCASLVDIDMDSLRVTLSSAGSSNNGHFQECTSLRELRPIIAGNIPYRAFFGCTSLESFHWDPKGSFRIGRFALSDCSNLKEIHVPKGTDPEIVRNAIKRSNSANVGSYTVIDSI